MGAEPADGQPAVPVIYLMGPTAAGKTALALGIAERYGCEIISVDSAQIYRNMDIGTAKPDARILKKCAHHLINIIDPVDSYSVARFLGSARDLIRDVSVRGNTPLLVGGTMLYFNALEHGLAALPRSTVQVRAQLQRECGQRGLQWLHEQLAEIDPESARRIHKNDAQRIYRALEIWRVSGQTMSRLLRAKSGAPKGLNALKLCIHYPDRSVLHRRIEQRFGQMLHAGLVAEVEGLRRKYPALSSAMPAMRCVGYRQAWQLLQGVCDSATMRERGIAATRQLARRQLTWLRAMQGVCWFDGGDHPKQRMFAAIDEHLQQ